MGSSPSGLSMWSRACAMIDEAERRHRRFFELLAVPSQQPAWEPPVDMFLLERELQVLVALPGVRADEFDVELSSSGLRRIMSKITGEKMYRPAMARLLGASSGAGFSTRFTMRKTSSAPEAGCTMP